MFFLVSAWTLLRKDRLANLIISKKPGGQGPGPQGWIMTSSTICNLAINSCSSDWVGMGETPLRRNGKCPTLSWNLGRGCLSWCRCGGLNVGWSSNPRCCHVECAASCALCVWVVWCSHSEVWSKERWLRIWIRNGQRQMMFFIDFNFTIVQERNTYYTHQQCYKDGGVYRCKTSIYWIMLYFINLINFLLLNCICSETY